MPIQPDDFERLRPAADVDPTAPRARRRVRGEAVESGPVALVPRGAGEILDLALDLLRDRFVIYVGLAFVAWLPARALQPFIGIHLWTKELETGSPDEQMSALFGIVSSFGLTYSLAAIVQAITSAMIAVQVESDIFGRGLALGEIFRRVGARVPRLLTLGAIIAFAKMVGSLTCILYFVAAWLFSLAPIVFAVEGAGVRASLRRSTQLGTDAFARFNGMWIAALLLSWFFEASSGIGDSPVVREWILEKIAVSAGIYDALLIVASSMFAAVGTAILASALTVYYVDCRVRCDGLDLRVTLRALESEAANAARVHANRGTGS